MKRITETMLGSAAIAALVAGAMAVAATPAAAGNAYGKDNNPGKANGHAENGGPAATGNGNGNLASTMGSLNAAHASANGLAHANRLHSRVGLLAAYMDAMVVYETEYGLVEADYLALKALLDPVEAQIAVLEEQKALLDPVLDAADIALIDADLAPLYTEQANFQAQIDTLMTDVYAAQNDAVINFEGAANKDGLIDATVVDAVNSLLDGKSEDFTHTSFVHESEQGIADIINPPE